MRYFGTFIPGAEKIVSAILAQRLSDLEIAVLDGGAVEFSTATPYSDLNLFCFNNLFQVLYSASAAEGKTGLERFVKSLPAAPADWRSAARRPAKCRTFRLVTSCQNQLTAVSPGAKGALEKKLASLTGLRVDRSLPDSEFWVLTRRGGQAYFLRRLSRHRAYNKLLHPGELHPELAYMLCWLTAPRPDDVVLDPFCGYGAVPAQRCRRFPYRKILAADRDPAVLKITREKLPAQAAVLRLDALRLDQALEAESVSAIITDPPWGLYESLDMPLEAFYERMLGQFFRVLGPGGRAVVLTAGKRELEGALAAQEGLALQARHDILVSGKKCGIFLLEKSGAPT